MNKFRLYKKVKYKCRPKRNNKLKITKKEKKKERNLVKLYLNLILHKLLWNLQKKYKPKLILMVLDGILVYFLICS